MARDIADLGPALQRVCKRLMLNQNLMKLLYYTDKKPLDGLDFTEQFIKDNIYEKLLKVVPWVGVKDSATSIVVAKIGGGTVNDNSSYTNVSLDFEIFVPMKQWIIKDANLRPFSIMSEISKSINGKVVDSVGKIRGGTFELTFLTDEISCYTQHYEIIVNG